MKIYDENWNELTAPDLNAGWLENTWRLVAHHDASRQEQEVEGNG